MVTRTLERGGTETHLIRILPEVRSAGIDISLFVFERGGALEPELAAAGVPISGPCRHRGRLAHLLPTALELARHIRRERPDAVHCFLPEPYVVSGLISPFAGRPLRLMSRRSLSDYQAKYPLIRPLERILHRSTAALLGNSRPVVQQLIDESADQDKVGLIANGVPEAKPLAPEARAALRQALGLADASLVLIVVANLIPYKGHADLLNALALAKSKLPTGWRLLVAGRDDGILNALREKAESLGIAENVLWLGERRDVPNLLQISDIAVLASHQEGSPNSLIESMMAGLPVVATAVGGSVELVTGPADRASGLLVKAHAPEDLGAAIARLAVDTDLRRNMGLRAGEKARLEYSMAACVSRYVALYRGLEGLRRGLSVESVLATITDHS